MRQPVKRTEAPAGCEAREAPHEFGCAGCCYAQQRPCSMVTHCLPGFRSDMRFVIFVRTMPFPYGSCGEYM